MLDFGCGSRDRNRFHHEMGFLLLKNNGRRAGQLGLKIFRRKAGHKPKKGESEKKKVRVRCP